jgi:outer membrane protein TolC
MALKAKDGLAMRLTYLGKRLALLTALIGALAPMAGCRRSPYIDQEKVVPHDPMAAAEDDDKDKEVKQAQLILEKLPMPLPKVAPPRTTSNPEASEIWNMTLQECIRIGLDNSEVIRVIALGAQGIPIGGFEPTPLNTGAGGALGTGTLATVYDPAIQETQIAQALSAFDANLSTTLFWNKNVAPFNNAITAGTFIAGAKNPVVFDQEVANFASTLTKRGATGTTYTIAHNIVWNFTNSPTNVFPSAYTTNTQFSLTQPLLGSAPTPNFNPNPLPAGLEANRAPIVIARLNADVAVWRFKAEVQAHVRSVEQQYWALAQAQVQHWASETAVDLGEQILKREMAKLIVGVGAPPNVAEAQEQLERFRLDLVDKTANLITTERQLRNILGLPPADSRRINPVTAPTDARVEPDWETCLRQMVTFQPDIVQQQLLTRVAELQLLSSRNQLLPVLNLQALYQLNGLGHHLDQAESVMTGREILGINPMLQAQQRLAGLNPTAGLVGGFSFWQVGLTFQMPIGYRGPLANARQAQYTLLRQRAFTQQTVHQTTHSLYRFFIEVDSNYKLFKTATNLKKAALVRLEAQRAYYENGSITIDRYLEALRNWSNAVAQEADFRTRYNTAIAALEESKGTLLAYNNIALAEGPWPRKAYVQARGYQQPGHSQHPIPGNGPYHPNQGSTPSMPDPFIPHPPEGFGPPEIKPLLPAPPGPLGPPPAFAPGAAPAGEPNFLSRSNPAAAASEPNVKPAAGTTEELPSLPPMNLPPLPRENSGNSGELPPLPPS